MNDFDAVLAHRINERIVCVTHRCDACGVKNEDVDLYAEDPETGDSIFMCPLCVAQEDMAAHKTAGLNVVGLVRFDLQKTTARQDVRTCRMVYGTLLEDNRILWGNTEVTPQEYEKVTPETTA